MTEISSYQQTRKRECVEIDNGRAEEEILTDGQDRRETKRSDRDVH